jgi:hypothetical protein
MAGSGNARLWILAAVAVVLGLGAVWLLEQTRSSTNNTTTATKPATPAPTTATPNSATETVRATAPAVPTGSASAAGSAGSGSERDANKAQRKQWMDTVTQSGLGREPWTPAGEALIDQVGAKAEHTESGGCWTTGCMGTYTFTSRSVYDEVYADTLRSDGWTKWTGGKRWSKPEQQDDGKVVVGLFLYRPD